MKQIELGAVARDSVTGFQGVCVCISQWLGGSPRVTLQPAVGKDGKLPTAETFEEANVVVLKAAGMAGKPATKLPAGKPMTK
jgi:hypothetical protein